MSKRMLRSVLATAFVGALAYGAVGTHDVTWGVATAEQAAPGDITWGAAPGDITWGAAEGGDITWGVATGDITWGAAPTHAGA